jgi:long-chain acyl-CoA synthetase
VCLATLNNGLAFNAGVLPALLGGARLAVHSGPLLPRRVARTLTSADATVLVAFPYAYSQLATVGVVAPAGLRLAVSAAAPMPARVRDAWAAAGRPICDYYGLVEVGPCTFNDGSAPDSLGRPLPGVTIEVVDETTGAAVPAGTCGRILVSSPSMAADYADAATPRFADQCIDGQYLTSDVGSIDGTGLLRLHGRVGPVVNLAGRKIDPDEVRAAAMALPAVSDAVAFPVRGAARTVLALVVAGDMDRLDRAGVVGGLQRDLADYKIPQIIEIVPEIPRGSAGKPLLDRLRQITEITGGGAA